MKKYIKLLRVKHYLKNGLIFLPLIFSKNLFITNKFLASLLGFISFSLIASIVYIINDIKDIEKDKNHPIKKTRPIASGEISIFKALVITGILLFFSIIIMFFGIKYFNIKVNSIIFLLIYLIINIIYSFGFKNIPIVDVIILSSGFIIRILFGGSIGNIEISNWLFLTVLSMSLYLVLGKRRNELIKNNDNSRYVLSKYNKEFLDKNMYMFLSMTLIFYCLWIVGENLYVYSNSMIYSILIVIFIIMRYNLILEKDSFGDPVDVVSSDKILLSSIILYLIYMGIVLYY